LILDPIRTTRGFEANVNDHGSLLLVDEKEVKVVEVEREMMTRE
jgi:hypothetical protein